VVVVVVVVEVVVVVVLADVHVSVRRGNMIPL
jgi:hypothetical protein